PRQRALPDARGCRRDGQGPVLHQARGPRKDDREVGARLRSVRGQPEAAMSARRWWLAIAFALTACGAANAEVTRVEITKRADVGTSGYEKIVGTIHFAVDPKLPRNRVVVDLDKAPTNAAGLVEFTSDLYILRSEERRVGK